MAAFRRFLLRLVHFFQPHRAEAELERELAAHLGVLEDEYRRRGLTDADARLAARRALGGVAQAKELHRDARSFRWLNDLRQDARFAVRALLRAPGFTAVVVGTLALGIGANTAIFSVVNAVLLRSLPFPGADRFVRIAMQFDPDDGSGIKTSDAPMTFEDLEVLRSRSRTLSNLGTYVQEAVTLSGRGEAAHLSGVRISPQVMAMLEATPLMGRLLQPRDERPGLDQVAVISYSMWQRRFGADDAILGKTIALDGIQYEIVGVMRRGFQFPNADAEFWRPFVWGPRHAAGDRRAPHRRRLFPDGEHGGQRPDAARAGGSPVRWTSASARIRGRRSTASARARRWPSAASARTRSQDRHLHRAGARPRALGPSVRSRAQRGSSSSPCTLS